MKFYVLTEVDADLSPDLDRKELRRRVIRAVEEYKKHNDGKFYVQGVQTLAVHDEKGNEIN